MHRIAAWVVFLFLLAPAYDGGADVLSSSPSGFLIKNEASIGADPDSVFDALVKHIGGWWDPAHTFSGDSRNLTLQATVGGCFCEALPNDGGVRHMEVVYIAPGKTLRMTGALGPLPGTGLTGSMTWSFQENGDSTKVGLSYSVGGYYDGDFQQIAPVVDSVLRSQLLRLKAFTETGGSEAE